MPTPMTEEEKAREAEVAQIVYKATIDGSTLPQVVLGRQQTEEFLDMVVDESALLKRVRNVRSSVPSWQINKLDLSEPVTELASLTHSERAPSESVVNLDTVKLRSTFDLKSDFTEDIRATSPEEVRRRIANMFAVRIGMDIELLGIQGDDSISTSITASDRLLKANDGWIQLLDDNAPAAQIIDAAGTTSCKKLFYDLIRKMPNKYKKMRQRLVWIVPPAIVEKWAYDLTGRATMLGDDTLVKDMNLIPGPFGIPMLPAGLMPEDQSYGTLSSTCARIILCDPKNLIYAVQREVKWEWERVPRSDAFESTVHTRVDFQIENVNACVMAKNVETGDGTDYTG